MSESRPDVTWRGPDGEIIACIEKLKVLAGLVSQLESEYQDSESGR